MTKQIIYGYAAAVTLSKFAAPNSLQKRSNCASVIHKLLWIRCFVCAKCITGSSPTPTAQTVSLSPKCANEIESTPLFVDKLAVIVRKEHSLAARKSVTLADVEKYPMALPSRGLQARMVLDQLLAGSGMGGILQSSWWQGTHLR